jgi:hypothetical protein
MQRFASERMPSIVWKNGAGGHRPHGALPFDTLGPYAKVVKCPIEGTDLRLTCYATAHADTFYSVPACTRFHGKYVTGFFMLHDDGPVFVPNAAYAPLFAERKRNVPQTLTTSAA